MLFGQLEKIVTFRRRDALDSPAVRFGQFEKDRHLSSPRRARLAGRALRAI
ncbi:hypothetical protein [Nannocystis pusilla]|uniref:hypothetical protein n=1 Tax=Nannocystis pusilla TaxID=889268 RepID=UPI003B7B013F